MGDNNDLTMLRQIAQSGRINPSTSTTNSSTASSEALRPLMEGTLSLYYELNTSNDSSDPSDV